MCKTLELKQKRIKLVDASSVAVRVHAEKAVCVEEEQWQVVYKSGRLPGTGRKPWSKRGKLPHLRGEKGP